MKLVVSVSILALISVSAFAQISPVGSFVGTSSEGFESFVDYGTSGGPLATGTSVFGGNATLNGSENYVYGPGAGFGLGYKGLATTATASECFQKSILSNF